MTEQPAARSEGEHEEPALPQQGITLIFRGRGVVTDRGAQSRSTCLMYLILDVQLRFISSDTAGQRPEQCFEKAEE